MKHICAFLGCSIFIQLTGFGQNSVKWGLNTGIAMSNPEVSNVLGSEFKAHRLYTVAPTGINLSMDVNKNWNMEFSYSFMNTLNETYDFENDVSNHSSRSSGQATQLFSFKYKRRIQLSERVSLYPYVGLSHISIDQGMGRTTDLLVASTSSSEKNGTTIRDTFFTSRAELNNYGFGLDVGAEVQVKIAHRLYLTSQINYMHNPETHTIHSIFYARSDGDPSAAMIAYRGSAFFLQAGLKWHWKDLASVKSKEI